MHHRLLPLSLSLAAFAAGCPGPVRPIEDVVFTDNTPTERATPDVQDVTPVDATADAPAFDALDAAPDVALADAAAPDAPVDAPLGLPFCMLGVPVAGLTVPDGFCVREFASDAQLNPRTMVFAPNGDLFVGSPSAYAPGGSGGGRGAVLVLPDDDHDGHADGIGNFAEGVALANVHGLALGGGYLYFTVLNTVFRTPYVAGQRVEMGTRENLGLASDYSMGRWTHGLARSAGGQLYTSRGEDSAACSTGPIGSVFSLGASGALGLVADGFRNPMYLRCHYRDELCMASELGEDQAGPNSREKLVVIDTALRHYGYPHCYRATVPTSCGAAAECASPGVSTESFFFDVANTPFGLDWEHDQWPAPYTGGLFVALHGSFYNPWQGAGVVFVPTDPTTHRPTGDAQQMFVQGFGNPSARAERPADVLFAPDGRLFFSADVGNKIYWIAPTTLRMPAR